MVIRDRRDFARRLAAAAHALGSAELRQSKANYVDPLIPKSPNIFAPLAKPFGYTYQAEYRFCWLPKPPVSTVDPVDLELGPLHDIAELVVI